MELSLDFTCPQCAKPSPVRLDEMAPGRKRLCPLCGVAVELTADALQAFRQALEAACRP